jgi:hypothetical protein
MILFFAKSLFHENLPGNQTFPITYEAIVRMELYPKTKKAEAEYWLNFLFAVASVTLWFFLPFGVLAYFILARG